MILHLTDVSDDPLHAQISQQIRALILAGELEAGDALPSIRGLARQERVSVITVQRAYDDLEREELIQARRGKGFFVVGMTSKRKTDMAQERLRETLEAGITSARAEGLDDEQIAAVFRALLGDGGGRRAS